MMPIARREMLLLARSPTMYRARLTTGVLTLVGGIAFGILYSRLGIGTAPAFIGVLGYMLSIMCMFTGAQVCADSISKEKREGTLGFLFLAGLPGWQITLGKLIANGLSAFFGIFVTFPLLSLLLIVGGVRPLQVFQMALTILNTLFVSASMGLFVSTISLEQKRAIGRASMIVMFFWWGLPMLARLNSQFGGPPWLTSAILLISLNSSFLPTFFSPFGAALGTSGRPWWNLLAMHLLGWFFLALATWTILRRWQDKPERPKFSIRAGWKGLSFGTKRVRERLRARLLDPNPFVWLAARDRLRFLGAWILTLAMLGVGGFIYYFNPGGPGPALGICIGATMMHRFWVCGMGAAQLLAEQEQGTLEMLFSTPLGARDVLRGQFRATVRQLRGPVLLVLLLHVAVALLIEGQRAPAVEMIAVLGSLFFYLFDLYTAIWLSMWGAVIARNPKHAGGAAIARLMGIPFFTVATATIVITVLNAFFGFGVSPSPAFVATCIGVLIIMNNIYWIRRVRRDLPGLLRTYAFRRYESTEEKGFFAMLGRNLGRFYAGFRTNASHSSNVAAGFDSSK